jgi:hypothetical protein
MSTPAGWYPQPDGRERWWDGTTWTEDFSRVAAPPVTIPAAGDDPARPWSQNQPVFPVGDQLPPAPGMAPVPGEVKGSNGLAIAGFVLALVGALSSFIPIINIGGDLLALLGLIFGVIGLVKSGSKGTGKGLSIAAIILAVVAFVISVVINTTTVTALNTAVKNLPSAPATSAAPGKTNAGIGDTIALKGIDAAAKAQVTAMKVVDPATSTSGFDTPAAGSRYVAVQFQIQNTGTVVYDDAPGNSAKIADTSGHQFDSVIVDSVTAGPLFPTTLKISPGEKAVGYLVFELPTTSKVANVQFTLDSGFADDTGQWAAK